MNLWNALVDVAGRRALWRSINKRREWAAMYGCPGLFRWSDYLDVIWPSRIVGAKEQYDEWQRWFDESNKKGEMCQK